MSSIFGARPCRRLLEALCFSIAILTAPAAWALGATSQVIMNQGGGLIADGSDGIEVYIGSNSQVQVRARGENGQFYSPGATPMTGSMFNSIALRLDGVGGIRMYGNADNSSAPPFTRMLQDSQSLLSGTGTAADPFRVTTTLKLPAPDNSVTIVITDTYVRPQMFFHRAMTVTGLPPTDQARLYWALDTFLGGSDAGPGYTQTTPGNVTGTPDITGVFRPDGKTQGLQQDFSAGTPMWDQYFTGGYWMPFSTLINGTGDLGDLVDPDPDTDNGLAVQWNIPLGQTTFSTATSQTYTATALTALESFTPDTIIAGNTSRFAVQIFNGGSIAGNLAFTYTLPPQVVATATPNMTSTCTTGTPVITISGSTMTVTNLSMPAAPTPSTFSDCTISFDVTSATPGTYTAAFSSPNSTVSHGPSVATLTVTAPPAPTVSIAKTTTAVNAIPGGAVAYTITVTNTGTLPAGGTVISDPLPAGLTAYTWTCAASGGAACPAASGNSALNETIATLPTAGVVTYTINATVAANPPASVTNTATATLSGGRCAPGNTPSPCTSSAPLPPVPVIQVNKTGSASSITAGDTVTYTLTVTNTSNVAASNTVISDPIPTGLSAYIWSCAATGGAVCPAVSGAGALSQTIATLPANSAVTYTISATVGATPPVTITNIATITPPPGSLCAPGNTPAPCSSSVPLTSAPLVQVSKTSSASPAVPGGTVVYTLTVANTGMVAANNSIVADPIAAGLTAYTWTCTPTGGALCPAASGNGALNQTISKLPVGGSLIYTITATVAANPPTSIANTATVTPPTGGLCAPGLTPPPCTGTALLPPAPAIQVSKTANVSGIVPGGSVVYTLTAANTSNVAANNTVVSDPIPAGLTGYTWNCNASGSAVCPAASGSGALSQTIATLPANSAVIYTISATIDATPPVSITNTATVTPPAGGVCAPGNTPAPCQARVVNTNQVATLVPVPTLASTLLGALIAIMCLMGAALHSRHQLQVQKR